MLLGLVDSGKSVLTDLIAGGGGGGGRRNDRRREVNVKLNPDEPGIRVRLFEPAVVDISEVCLDTVREQTGDTCFVVVVDINKSAEFANELVGLKELSEYLSDWSYSLFGNSMIVFTHIDELSAEVNRDRLVEGEFQEILSLLDNRFMFLNCTDGSQESRSRALEQILQLSKPTLRIVCYGNTQCPSSRFENVIKMPEFATQLGASGLKFNFHPDLSAYAIDIAEEFDLSPQLIQVIGQADETGSGIDVYAILFTLTISYDVAYEALMNYFPGRYGLNTKCGKYFWSRAVVIFHMNEGNYPAVIKHY